MTATPYDSLAWRALFHDKDLAPLFTDTAELRAILIVMGTLAQTQAKAGIVPEVSAKAIYRAALEVQIDPAGLAETTAKTADPVKAIIKAFQHEMKAPEHAKWVHYDSATSLTSATGQSLRLRQALRLIGARLPDGIVLPQTTWLRAYHLDPTTRKALAEGLDLTDAGAHAPQDAINAIGQWLTDTATALHTATKVTTAIRHHIPSLNTALQSASPDIAPLITTMTLPQMILGLGKLLPPAEKTT